MLDRATVGTESGDRRRWDRYLAEYHEANPGITEHVFADARDRSGCSPYEWLVAAVPPGASTVVDLACGSGPVGRLLAAERDGTVRVVGVDLSFAELNRARSVTAWALLVRARATALPIAGATADAVVASMALMLVPLESVLAEVGRLLRPGGTFAATVPTRSTGAAAGTAAGGAAAVGAAGGGSGAGTAEASAFAEILEALGQAGMDYPEPLGAGDLADRFSGSGLTLCQDHTALFTRTVSSPDEAGAVVRSFYAPGVGGARVAAAVEGFQRRLRSAPVRLEYRVRRLVAVRSP
ncbi:MAG TPA: class I SAM-dependent methyltransferase [Acidimicrobiales bacterium]|nr:class I SAM-dependent methyltransferase [Acidimicrobiales bacterium]